MVPGATLSELGYNYRQLEHFVFKAASVQLIDPERTYIGEVFNEAVGVGAICVSPGKL